VLQLGSTTKHAFKTYNDNETKALKNFIIYKPPNVISLRNQSTFVKHRQHLYEQHFDGLCGQGRI